MHSESAAALQIKTMFHVKHRGPEQPRKGYVNLIGTWVDKALLGRDVIIHPKRVKTLHP
jgi:hypothetical protein